MLSYIDQAALSKPARTFGVDRAMITFGDQAFKAFRIDKLGDYASEKIIQHVFSLRAFVSPKDSEDLIRIQAVADKIERDSCCAACRRARRS